MGLRDLSRRQKFLLLGCLYFSQGLPFGFFTQALPAILRSEGMSLGKIGLTSLLAIPWGLKFLWAPLVDRYGNERFGRRRSWIVPLQLLAAAVLFAFALRSATGPTGTNALLFAVFMLNLLAATQDIATDGLAVDALKRSERGLANGLQVAGYRVGMVVGGGALLMLHDELGMAGTFFAMGTLVALATIPIGLTKEGPSEGAASAKSTKLWSFFRRPGAATILLLIATYKFGDAFAQGMLRPFLTDLGLDLADLGRIVGTAGFIAGLLGALAGGALMERFSRKRALLIFGALQALSLVPYAALAMMSDFDVPTLYAISAFEHFAGGMATAALFTCMMDWCGDEGESATDYTVQASVVVLTTGLAATLSGFFAQSVGYAGHFATSVVLSLTGVALAFVFFPREQEPIPPVPQVF
ncbi:MAG: MFS transporter [Myxococcota bacterium]